VTEFSTSLTISEEENDLFAQLSGDYNPLHVDHQYARRLQFGRPVIHGIHHLLRSLNLALGSLSLPVDLKIRSLRGRFPKPAWVDHAISIQGSYSSSNQLLKLTADCDRQTILNLQVEFGGNQIAESDIKVNRSFPPKEKPVDQSFPPSSPSGDLELYLEPEAAHELFPKFCRVLPPLQLSQILACTRLVGMRSPGLHSIFSAIQLDFDSSDSDECAFHYDQCKVDARVKLLNMTVQSTGLEGRLTTFYRPKPAKQPSFSELCQLVKKDEFRDQCALIVGGSRGIGETTAKLLAAGGAEVTITYFQGNKEAGAVADEICRGGGRCDVIPLNVVDFSSTPNLDRPLTHVYYFASPHIEANLGRDWSETLFNRYLDYYVVRFNELVRWYKSQSPDERPVSYFYPSSVFVESPVRGFAEYATAKGAGETLCCQLNASYPNNYFYYPRLPRVLTDQTVSIIPIDCELTEQVMLRELQKINRSDREKSRL